MSRVYHSTLAQREPRSCLLSFYFERNEWPSNSIQSTHSLYHIYPLLPWLYRYGYQLSYGERGKGFGRVLGLDTTIIFALSHLLRNSGIEVCQILLMVFFSSRVMEVGFQSKLLAWLPNHYNPIIRVHAYMHKRKKRHWPRDYCHWSYPAKKKVRQKSWLFNLHVMPWGSVGCKRAAQELTIRTCMWCQGHQIWISMRHLACRLFCGSGRFLIFRL